MRDVPCSRRRIDRIRWHRDRQNLLQLSAWLPAGGCQRSRRSISIDLTGPDEPARITLVDRRVRLGRDPSVGGNDWW